MKLVKCIECEEDVPEDYFFKNKRRRASGKVEWELRPECKDCTNLKNKLSKVRSDHKIEVENKKKKGLEKCITSPLT